MTPDSLRDGLKAAMRHKRQGPPSERAGMQSLIAAGLLVLRAMDAVSAPDPEPTVPGDFSPTAYTPAYARTELATLWGGMPT